MLGKVSDVILMVTVHDATTMYAQPLQPQGVY